MRYIATVIFISYICFVLGKNNVKTLTESMGQEVIEIEGPKELPPGLEEEPGAESGEDDSLSTTASATKKDNKRTTTLAVARKSLKDIDKIDGTSPEDEEARLEKELAEIYKDTDYKDITEETVVTKETTTATVLQDITELTEKPIGRSKNGFKFAPDSTDKKDIERFRTSVDDISCKNRQKLSVTSPLKKPDPNQSDSSVSLCPVMIITQLSLALGTLVC